MDTASSGGTPPVGCAPCTRLSPYGSGRDDFADRRALAEALAGVDAVIHIAGVNRAESDAAVEQGNIALAETWSTALAETGGPVDVVYANSVQADLDNAYGRGKARVRSTAR